MKDPKTGPELLSVQRRAIRARAAVARRDEAIRGAHKAGHSLREIGAWAELPHVTVKRILDRGACASFSATPNSEERHDFCARCGHVRADHV